MIGAKVGGIPELREALAGVAPKLRVRALRNALGAGAREVRAAMRSAAPSLSSLDAAVVRGRRTPGLLKKSIVVRTSREARKAGNVGVFVNVRPAKAGNRGAKSKLDPFYWRFVAFGTRFMSARNFFDPGAQALGRALSVFNAKILPAIAKLDKPRAPAP